MLFMLVLSILSLVGLAVSTVGHLDQGQKEILEIADLVVCGLFFIDFLVSLHRAPNRLKYFLRWGWLDLLSSIPMISTLRLTRAARIFRILRLIRGIKATKILAQFILNRRAESAFLAVSLVSLLLIVVASIAILQFEGQPDSNIKNAEDAVWWAISTITTVGYGDRYPVTYEGRVVASILMICGVGLFGTLSGFVASWFLKPAEDARESEMAKVLLEIRELKAQLKPPENRT
jgi:voltage-gated potassium channel